MSEVEWGKIIMLKNVKDDVSIRRYLEKVSGSEGWIPHSSA